MNLLQYRIAVQSLKMNRVRTILTTLGIIIGVASITLVLALGRGVENTVSNQVTKLGDNLLLITSGAQPSVSTRIEQYNPYALSPTTSLTEQDLNSINLNQSVKQAAPIMLLGGTISAANGVKRNVTIVASTPSLASIVGLSVDPGQFLDNSTSRETAVIGAKLANEVYGNNQVIGQQFSLKGRTHTIVGVLKQTDAPINLSGVDVDNAVFVSFDDGKSFNQGIAEIQQILVTAKDVKELSSTRETIDQSLFNNHQQERDFTVLAGQDVAEHGNSTFRAIVVMTAFVAAITLVVGGIGIMNIMLVGVSERTREIGIRKALGATNAHILGQFLIEALIMCFVGGCLGLALAYALAFAIATELSFQPAITWQIIATGLGMAFATGILFGLYPALKAARKDPIESLRQYH